MIWLAYISLDSIFNWWLIVKKKTVPLYLPLFLFRGCAAIAYGAFVYEAQVGEFLPWLLSVTLPFPFLFNTLLNTFRKKEIDYCGKDSGWIDSYIVSRNYQRLYYWITLILFLIWLK